MESSSRQSYTLIASLAVASAIAFFLVSGSISGTKSSLILNAVDNASVRDDVAVFKPEVAIPVQSPIFVAESRTQLPSAHNPNITVKFMETYMDDLQFQPSSFSVSAEYQTDLHIALTFILSALLDYYSSLNHHFHSFFTQCDDNEPQYQVCTLNNIYVLDGWPIYLVETAKEREQFRLPNPTLFEVGNTFHAAFSNEIYRK